MVRNMSNQSIKAVLLDYGGVIAEEGFQNSLRAMAREQGLDVRHGDGIAALAATGPAAFKTGFGPLAPDFMQTTQPSPGRCGHCDLTNPCTLACLFDMEALIAREGADTISKMAARGYRLVA